MCRAVCHQLQLFTREHACGCADLCLSFSLEMRPLLLVEAWCSASSADLQRIASALLNCAPTTLCSRQPGMLQVLPFCTLLCWYISFSGPSKGWRAGAWKQHKEDWCGTRLLGQRYPRWRSINLACHSPLTLDLLPSPEILQDSRQVQQQFDSVFIRLLFMFYILDIARPGVTQVVLQS